MSLNLASIPLRAAQLHAKAPAILMGESIIDYAGLARQIKICATALQSQGLSVGDNVSIMLPNIPQFTMSYFACLSLGATVVPLNVLFVEEELKYHLTDSQSKAIIVWEDFLDRALPAANASNSKLLVIRNPASPKELPEACLDLAALMADSMQQGLVDGFDIHASDADDTAVILYTSGTTGRPKGAELTHFNMYDNARYVSERLSRTCTDTLNIFSSGHVALASLPLFHSFGQTVIQNAFLMNGAAISLMPRFAPVDAARQIQQHKVTFFAGVPTMYLALLHDPAVSDEQLGSLQFAVSGGAALPVEVIKQFKQRFNIDILEGYGLSETSPVACFNNLMQQRKPGTVGPAIDLCEVGIKDENQQFVPNGRKGEIVIRGSNIMKGYYQRPEASKEVLINGWFHTGDIGIKDDEGYISIVDRKKDMIIRGGYNVYPREVEEVLYQHPAIVEAAVIGVPDENYGEEIMAVVVAREGSEIHEDEIEQFCRQHLAPYKVPRKLETMDSLPKNSTGKILKRLIKEQVTAAMA